MTTIESLRAVGAEIGALLLAASCPGCGLPGTLLCDGCRARLRAAPVEVRTPAGMPVRAALVYEGVAARCIRRLKGEGQTLLAHPLGAALAAVLPANAILPESDVVLVPVPTSRASFRRRGYRVPELLVRRAGGTAIRALRAVGGTADQRGLGAQERAENVRGSMVAIRNGGGATAVIIDDVITTGATLDVASEVLREAGFDVIGGAVLAATERHSRP